MLRALILSGLLLAAAGPVRAADAVRSARAINTSACDALTARVIRITGASLAGIVGPYAVFRAEDAERMSLDCRAPARITLASRDREPRLPYFALVGLAARALTGADAGDAEVLALNLHQDSLLAQAPRRGGTGPALMLCETGPRVGALQDDRTVCRVAPASAARAGVSRRRRAG